MLCVGSTGLTAQNLEAGRTARSRLKIPIPVFENSVCTIKAKSSLAKLVKESRLIIWDEIFSVHLFNVECVERTLRPLIDSEHPLGGKAVLLGGDKHTPSCQKSRQGSNSQSLHPNVTPISSLAGRQAESEHED